MIHAGIDADADADRPDPLPPPEAAAPADPRAATAARLAATAAVAACLAWAYLPELRWLWQTWGDDPNYSHGYLVAPVAAVVFWRRGGKPATAPTRPRQWAWAVLALALAGRAYAYEHGHLWLQTMTLLPALGALALTLGGWGLLRRAWPALAFLVFMVPLPAQLNALLAQPLQSLATSASVAALKLTGLWVIAEGNVIYVGDHPLSVAEACNGLSMMMSLMATVVATLLLVPLSVWMRTVMVLSAAPIALASNVARIVATAWCVERFGAEAGARFAHDLAGWLMMPLALLIVGVELALLAWVFTEEEYTPQPTLLGKPIPSKGKDPD